MAMNLHTHDPQPQRLAAMVIGHRGACGYVPEHTLVSYFIAAQQGADYIEPDLVMTRDGVLVARHENEIGGTTNVAQRPEFAGRKTTKLVDGEKLEGWFTEDFTLAELKTLRARERIPELRPDNARFDDQFEIPTFEEIMALVQSINLARPKTQRIGVYPETKHPSYFKALGLAMETPLLEALERWDYAGPDAPVFIQSFEAGNLMELRQSTHLPLVQLIEAKGQPYDFTARGDVRTYADLITPVGLKAIAEYADVIGVNKLLIIPRNTDNSLGEPTSVISNAHVAGLKVHGWTFRAEEYFLPRGISDMTAEVQAYLSAGMDGFFTDHPALTHPIVF